MRLRGSALSLEGSFPSSIANLCPPYLLSPVSLHHLGSAISSSLEDDFAAKSLVESIDEKLLWPIYFVRVSHKFSRGSAFLCCLAHVIDINSLTVLGSNASTAREKTSLKEGNCDCWRTGFW